MHLKLLIMGYEYYEVIYQDKGQFKSYKCEAQSPEDAEDQLNIHLKGRRYRRQFEVIEIIPHGIVGGCEVTLYDRKIHEL